MEPNLCSLLDTDRRTEDDISNAVADIIRAYTEIETLPKQVAVFYIMTTLLKAQYLENSRATHRCHAYADALLQVDGSPGRPKLVSHPRLAAADSAPVDHNTRISDRQHPPVGLHILHSFRTRH